MLSEFLDYIYSNKIAPPGDDVNILLAVSGGVDSVVMTDLFCKARYRFSIAHVNFGLRGDESDIDNKFVKELAAKYNVDFYCKKVDTKEYASNKKVSIQMAARELRFNWFYELCEQNGFNFIATAHHADDQIETFFINLLRGSSLQALGSIKPVSGKVIHPLLFASRKQISEYSKVNNLPFREDSSNKSDKYLRNKIRLSLLPLLEEINPGAGNSVISAIDKLSDANEVVENAIETAKIHCIYVNENYIEIIISKLLEHKPIKLFLYEFIKVYGFNYTIVEEIIRCLDKHSGKQFLSQTHTLTIDRDKIIISKIIESLSLKEQECFIDKEECKLDSPVSLDITVFQKNDDFKIPEDAKIACLDYSRLSFPLKVRKWQKGDKFYPLGMKHPKKISDFLIDNKIPLPLKNNVYVLCSENNIVWVIGMRIDDRYKTNKSTKRIYLCKSV